MGALAEFAGERLQRLARVPESATVAPWPCSARAIAPPRPPEAPVTSAVFPVRSNTALAFPRLARLQTARAAL